MTVEGKRIAFLGNLSHKKGIQLMIEGFNAIYEADSSKTLHIGGAIQDTRYGAYLDHAILSLKLQDSIHYAGHVDNVMEWLQDKDYIYVSSPLEGCPVGVIEAMSVGLRPLIHSFVGAPDLYPSAYIWRTIAELVRMTKEGRGDPQEYRNFVINNYSLDRQLKSIGRVVASVAKNVKKTAVKAKNSTVTCVIAVKNGEKTIARTLESLHAQTYPLAKIILVNDDSTDKTLKVAREADEKSDIITQVVSLEPSKWVFSARNEGFKFVNTDYFFFLDADDYVPENYVKEMVKVLDNNPTVAVTYCDMMHFSELGKEKFEVPDFDASILMERNYIAYSSMQRTKGFTGYSEFFNDARNHLTEWQYWLNMIKNGQSFRKCTHTFFYYYRAAMTPSANQKDTSDGQMSTNYERPRLDMHIEMAMSLVKDLSDINIKGEQKRILLVCQGKDYVDRSKVGFELMTWCKPLEEFGDVFTFQYDVVMQHYGRKGMLDKLEDVLNVVDPSVIFHPTYKEDIPAETWKALSTIFKTVAWNSDDDRRYDEFTKEYCKNFINSVTTYPEIYNKMDHPGRLLSQWAANTSYFYPREKTIDVSFCGQKYGNREEMLAGLDVDSYGGGWDNGFIDFKEMAEVLGKSKISINFSGGADNNPQMKLRPFEICASGALCLCEYTPALSNYYVVDEEIKVFNTKEELDKLVTYYLEHEDEAEEIAKAGYDRTIAKHTWKQRFEEIFNVIYV
jgi:glycosyltransferase involved in cell wall biosynthesis